MNKQKWLVFWVVTALVGGSAVFLNRLQANYRLGNPGLKMVERPVYDTKTNVVCTTTVDLPVKVLGYTSEPLKVSQAELDMLPKDTTYGRRRYTAKDKFQTDISIVVMGKDRTSIHRPQICLEGQGWKVDRTELLTIPIPRPTPYGLPVMKLTASKVLAESGQVQAPRALFVYWFVSENRITARHGERMWWMATDLLKTGILSRWAYISYFAVSPPGQEEATFNRLKDFIAASVPEFQLVSGSTESKPVSAAVTRGR